MFISSPFEFLILTLGLIGFSLISFKRTDLALGIIVFSLPIYLIRLKIWFIPTTVLELMIYIVFLVWVIKKIKNLLPPLKNRIIQPLRSLKIIIFTDFRFPIFLILLGCIISIIVSPDKRTSLGIFKGWFIDPLLLFLVIRNEIRTKEQVRKILSFLAISGIVVAVISIFYYLFGQITFDGRLKAFFLSPNHLAMYLAPSGIVCLGLFIKFCELRDVIASGTKQSGVKRGNLVIQQKERDCFVVSPRNDGEILDFALQNNFKKYFYLLGFIICLIAFYLTYSYGAWLGFAFALLFLILFSSKNIFQKKKILILLIISLFLSTIFLLQIKTEKFQNLSEFSRSSLESRVIIWKASAAILEDHPFWGIGPGNFQDFYLEYQKKFPPYLEWAVPQPHNLFLAFYLQCGLIGLVGFLWLIILFFEKGISQIPFLPLTLILVSIMIYTLLHGLVDTPYWKNDLSIIFWVTIALMLNLNLISNKSSRKINKVRINRIKNKPAQKSQTQS